MKLGSFGRKDFLLGKYKVRLEPDSAKHAKFRVAVDLHESIDDKYSGITGYEEFNDIITAGKAFDSINSASAAQKFIDNSKQELWD